MIASVGMSGKVMDSYEESKTARRVVSVIYILIMVFLVAGSYLAQQRNTEYQFQRNVLDTHDIDITVNKPQEY